MTVIDWIDQVLVYKRYWESFTEEEQKKFSPFIVNRFLSMDEEFIEVVNMFQKYAIGTLESREVYKWYCDVLPKGKRYNKYIESNKDKKYDKLLISTMCKYFECSNKQASEYLGLIDKQELKEILKMYGIDDKQIKRVLK